ncbi:MAG: glycosyltransferase [Acidobacteriaceae bacterium]
MEMQVEALGRLRVLFVTSLTPNHFGVYRLGALGRLGLEHVAVLDRDHYGAPGIRGKVQFRLQIGPEVSQFNRDLFAIARREQAQIAIFDKALQLHPRTLRRLRESGVFCIDFVIDNPFGPRNDPGWRLYRRTVPGFDLTGVQRDVSLTDYRKAGAQEVVRILNGFERTVHYPPPPDWNDSRRDRQVSFIGTPYDDRADFLARLWRAGVAVDISGSRPHWQAALPADAFAATFRVGELVADAYREAIWRSRINLAFVTHSNSDQVAQKSFEITACGGFLLAERTAEHLACFREDEEAVFFSDFEECRAKIDRYLNDEAERARIAAAGQRRAWNSGYDNDSVLSGLLTKAAEMLAKRAGN